MKRLLMWIVVLGSFLILPLAAHACTGSVTWTGVIDTDWNKAGNWSPARVPLLSDDVCIPGGKTVTNQPGMGLGGGFINSLVLDGMLTIDSAALNLQSTSVPSTVNNLTLTSTLQTFSAITISGTATFTGNLVLSPGQVSGPGSATMAGTVTVSKGNSFLVVATVDNQGSITITQNSVQLTLGISPGTFTNEAGASVNLQGDGITILGGTTFSNSGLIAKTAGTLTSTWSQEVGSFIHNGTGAVVAQNGTFNFSGFGTSAGAFNASSGAMLQFSNQMTLNAGTTIAGAGTVDITAGGLWDLAAPITVQASQLSFDGQTGAVIRGNSDLTVNQQLTWNSGTISSSGGNPKLIVLGNMDIVTAGFHAALRDIDLRGTANLNADLQLSPSTVTMEKGTTFNVKTDNSIHGQGAINVGGTFEKTGGTGVSTLDFSGTFNLVTNSDQSNGTVAVHSGTLVLATVVGGAFLGTSTVDGGATLKFSAGTYSLAQGTAFDGAGTTLLTLANWTVNGGAAVNTSAFEFDGMGFNSGVINGAGNLTVNSPNSIWTGGWMQGTGNPQNPGTTTISAGVTVKIENGTSSNEPAVIGRTIDNFGTTEIGDSASALTLGGALWNNHKGATFDFRSDGNLLDNGNGQSTFNNDGTVEKTQGTLSNISFNGTLTNHGVVFGPASGTLKISSTYDQESGQSTAKRNSPASALPLTEVGGGMLSTTGTFNIQAGTIGGIGTISGPINNVGGTLQAGSASGTGTLSLSGGETQGANSTLTVVIAGTTPGTQYDQIDEANTITGNGTLRFQFSSGFTPAPTNTFDIVNFASGSGTLTHVITNGPTCKAKLTPTPKALNVRFTSTNVSVTINPPSVTLHENQQQQFTDTVTNGCGSSVTWSVHEPGGGTIDQTGLYTAPASTGTFHVVVDSVADPTKFAFATVTVTAPHNQLVVMPRAAVLQPGKSLSLHANRSVMWSIAEGRFGGSVTAGGSYTAPTQPGLYHVVASSTVDPSQHAIVNIAVGGGKLAFAYVADFDKNSISIFAPVASNESTPAQLRVTESVASGQKPVSLTISPQGKFVLSANQGSNDLTVFALSSGDGTLQTVPGTAVVVGKRPSAAVFDPSGGLLFVTNQDSDELSVFSMDKATGQLTFVDSQAMATGDSPSAIAMHPGGSMLFVVKAGTNTVQGFSYDVGGRLKATTGSALDTGRGPAAALIDAAGKFLFVANRDSGDISVFDIDAKNQTLQQLSGSPFRAGKGPAALALDLTGSYLLVADHDSNDIATFQIDGETGALTPLGRTLLLSPGPSALAVDPSGQYLYVTSEQSASLATVRLDLATGILTPTGKILGRGKALSIVLVGGGSERP
jgi:6-phosphogluconolactonase